MKNCPICNRTYEDDTLIYCLDDGTPLSAPYIPYVTTPSPTVRDTASAKTEILPPELMPVIQAPQNHLIEKRSNKIWIIISGMLTLAVIGLMVAFVYLWRENSKKSTASEPVTVSSPAPANNNISVNANRGVESNPNDTASFQWLDGVWTGKGYQSDTKSTWDVLLTVQNGTYTIEYPGIPCRGRWNLSDRNSRGANFIEVITQGTKLCTNNSHIMMEKISDSEISCKYTNAGSRKVIASVVLSKKPD